MTELFIRATYGDHRVVADLLAPRAYWNRGRPPIDRLVIDATLAAREGAFSVAAADAGIPLLVDPQTLHWQAPVDPSDAWCQLPYGSSGALPPAELRDPGRRSQLVREVIEAQLGHGASAVIAPYVYASAPGDPWFAIALDLVRDAARYIDTTDLVSHSFSSCAPRDMASADPQPGRRESDASWIWREPSAPTQSP